MNWGGLIVFIMENSFFKNRKQSNVLVQFLEKLDVKHTRWFATKFYQEHPHKYSLWGLSNMLSAYGVENAGVRLPDKKDFLLQKEVPFIAYVSSDFVVVDQVGENDVHYLWRGENIKTTIDKFSDLWSGVALIADPDEKSIEPDYNENRKKDAFFSIQHNTLVFSVIALVGTLFYLNGLFHSLGEIVSLFINLSGCYVGSLLLMKQTNINSSYADKMCSLLQKQGSCNDVLESDAARLGGVISWSEVGTAYFVSNVIVLLCMPQFLSYLAVINLFTLPYTIWSIWYQKVIAKQWCTLCVVVQGLLWLLFFTNLFAGFIEIPHVTFPTLVMVGCVYLIPYLLLSILVYHLARSNKIEQITQEINSMKASDEIFTSLLKNQKNYTVDKATSSILWGNPGALNLVTIITNPHCGPCATMHTRIKQLLENKESNLCIQYIFSSFNQELHVSAKFLIAAYLNNTPESFLQLLEAWYSEGKHQKEAFFRKYNFDMEDKRIEAEFANHQQWIEKATISSTPTILFNGYVLPEFYKVEDLVYFSALQME